MSAIVLVLNPLENRMGLSYVSPDVAKLSSIFRKYTVVAL